jgi:hypothetical protein
MGIIMQLLIDRANFRTTPGRENDWQGREQTRDTQSHPEPFVNHGVKFSSQKGNDRVRAAWQKLAPTKMGGIDCAIPPRRPESNLRQC